MKCLWQNWWTLYIGMILLFHAHLPHKIGYYSKTWYDGAKWITFSESSGLNWRKSHYLVPVFFEKVKFVDQCSRSWQPPWIISPYIRALSHGDCYLKFYPFSRWDGRLGKNKPLNIHFWLINFKRLTLEEKVMEQNIFKKHISTQK